MLTTEQRATLKAAILADPALAALAPSSNAINTIIEAYKAPASPAYTVWRTTVSQDEIMQNGFDWVRVDNLSVGKARIWEWLFYNSSRAIDPSKSNVRAGIAECWKGTTADLAVQAVVLGHCKRSANRLEALFATGAGSVADPATMVVQGEVSYNEVLQLMGW
jgi:hypothetical protein